jgi:hypothetical protein
LEGAELLKNAVVGIVEAPRGAARDIGKLDEGSLQVAASS